MPLPLLEVVLLLLWLLAAVCFLWASFPPLAHLVGVSGYTNRIDSPPASARLGDTGRYAHDVHQQLDRLGFTYLGSVTENHWLVGAYWRQTTCFRVFASARLHCFACLYCQARGEPVRVTFAAVFEDGALVWTANASETCIQDMDYVRQSVGSNDLDVVLRGHADVVAQFQRGGREPTAAPELAALATAVERFARVDHRQTRGACQEWLVRILHLLIAVPAVVAYLGIYPQWMAPLAIIVGALLYGRARRAAVREVVQLRRLEVLQQDEPTADAVPGAQPENNGAITAKPANDQFEARP